jgi:hypothetical protein
MVPTTHEVLVAGVDDPAIDLERDTNGRLTFLDDTFAPERDEPLSVWRLGVCACLASVVPAALITMSEPRLLSVRRHAPVELRRAVR